MPSPFAITLCSPLARAFFYPLALSTRLVKIPSRFAHKALEKRLWNFYYLVDSCLQTFNRIGTGI